MRPHLKWIYLLFGVVFWVVGTLWYGVRGPHVFETTSLRYWELQDGREYDVDNT
jgi:predicted membrane channel-forming protein YqfA (hemolysin III family)